MVRDKELKVTRWIKRDGEDSLRQRKFSVSPFHLYPGLRGLTGVDSRWWSQSVVHLLLITSHRLEPVERTSRDSLFIEFLVVVGMSHLHQTVVLNFESFNQRPRTLVVDIGP